MIVLEIIAALFVLLGIIALINKPKSVYSNQKDQQNPMEGKRVVFVEDSAEPLNPDGVRGHLEAVGESGHRAGFYEAVVKRLLDIILSFCGLILLSPLFLFLTIWIKVDDPGPALFSQKRVGRNKRYFKLHKFRSMKMSSPHNVPTHMLENPEQYITRAGKFIRSHSLDELPQIWDIFIGNMSIVGPRPGLWNQDYLIAERDKYGANDIMPGLTGLAQIEGRDKMEIPVKAKLDGEYAEKLGLCMDIRCFLSSLKVFKGDKNIVEGGTGEMNKNPENEK